MIKRKFRLWQFLNRGIWSIPQSDLSKRKSISIKTIRILIISIRGFYEDKIQQRAAAITLYSLLTLVPVLALGFGIAKGFGYDTFLENKVKVYLYKWVNQLSDNSVTDSSPLVKGYSDVVDQIITFSNATLARTKGGLLAGIGIILLFWAVMNVLSNIENSFNDIWQVKKGRSYLRRYSDYLSVMLISPVFLITAIAVNDKIKEMSNQVELVQLISPILFFILKSIPYILIIVLFTLVYIIMPNTKVKFRSGLTGGIIAGSVFLLVQMAYIHFQIGVSRNNAIYGSLAAIPLFIIWVQISWLIVLIGSKIAFATQNIQMYEFENEAINTSSYSHRIIALVVTHHIIMNFNIGEKSLTQSELSQNLHIPVSILSTVLSDLVKTRILCEVLTEKPGIFGYQPAQNVELLSISLVNESLDKLGENYPIENTSKIALKLKSIDKDIFNLIKKSDHNILIKDL
jgi:membrane protein